MSDLIEFPRCAVCGSGVPVDPAKGLPEYFICRGCAARRDASIRNYLFERSGRLEGSTDPEHGFRPVENTHE